MYLAWGCYHNLDTLVQTGSGTSVSLLWGLVLVMDVGFVYSLRSRVLVGLDMHKGLKSNSYT